MGFDVGNSGSTGSTIIDSTFRPGMIAMTAAVAPPTGFLMCDGDEYDPLTYPALFAQIGFTFNTGGETPGYFRVPAFMGRAPFGVGTAVTKMWALGEQYGSEVLQQHTHTVTDPGHNHTQNAHTHTVTDPGHNHTQNAHTHTVTDPGHTHTVTDPGHMHVYQGTINTGGATYPNITQANNTATNNYGTNSNTTGITNVSNTTGITNQNATATNISNTTGITNANATATNNSNTTGLTVDNSGTGTTGNIPPGLGINFIIKY